VHARHVALKGQIVFKPIDTNTEIDGTHKSNPVAQMGTLNALGHLT